MVAGCPRSPASPAATVSGVPLLADPASPTGVGLGRGFARDASRGHTPDRRNSRRGDGRIQQRPRQCTGRPTGPDDGRSCRDHRRLSSNGTLRRVERARTKRSGDAMRPRLFGFATATWSRPAIGGDGSVHPPPPVGGRESASHPESIPSSRANSRIRPKKLGDDHIGT